MAHTFLSLDMNLIPQDTKDNVPTFYGGLFSNDGSRMLIDGYNGARALVHPQATLNAWLQWEQDPESTLKIIIDNSIEYTAQQMQIERDDVNSIWYVEGVE